MNLFGEVPKEQFRTIGFYQPYASLMMHGKIETRWVAEDRSPAFPIGKYLIYTTLKPCDTSKVFNWSGEETMLRINELLVDDPSKELNGYAIAIGDLTSRRLLTKEDEKMSFVKFIGTEWQINFTSAKNILKSQWALIFENVQRIEPFEWKFGKQGVGFVPESELSKIKVI